MVVLSDVQHERLAQADFANRRRGVADCDRACVGLATAAAFSACGFRVAFGFAGAAGVTVPRATGAAFFATALLSVCVGLSATILAFRDGLADAAPIALVVLATAGCARRSDLTGLATLAPLVCACLVAFGAGFAAALVALVALGAALLAVELGGVIPLATLAALAALFGVTALGNFAVSGVAGFAIRATFSAFLSVTGTGFAVALVRFAVVGAVSQSVACCAAVGGAFFGITARFTEEVAGWTETAGLAARSATTAFAVLVAFGLVMGPFVAEGFMG